MKLDLPSAAFMARFMPKAAPEPEPKRPMPKMIPWFDAYLGTLKVGWKFTVAEACERCGYPANNVRVAIWIALGRGLIERLVMVNGHTQVTWRRTGVRADVSGVRQLGVDRIEAMPEGRVFSRSKLQEHMSDSSAHRAIRVAKRLGLIEAVGRVERPETTYRKVKP